MENKNYMEQVAKMLGVDIGEEFRVEKNQTTLHYANYVDTYKYKFDYFGLLRVNDNVRVFSLLNELICGTNTIIKQPKLSQAERTILENLATPYKWIVRDKGGILYVHERKPIKSAEKWINLYSRIVYDLLLFGHLFQFIKWENEEPYNIKELLGEE